VGTGYGPGFGQLRQLLLAAEVLGSGDIGGLGVFERSEGSDVVVAIDCKRSHFVNLLWLGISSAPSDARAGQQVKRNLQLTGKNDRCGMARRRNGDDDC